jgi:hypothetical protein
MGEALEMTKLAGRCLCGAVTVTATMSKPILRACHCEMCRQHTSGAFFSMAADPDSIVVVGPVVRLGRAGILRNLRIDALVRHSA